jgi:hypothetical protein
VAADSGYTFGGSGYVILAKNQFRPAQTTLVRLSIKTLAENGLIFVIGSQEDFLSIEMKDGFVVYQFDLGSGPATLKSNQRFNDGEWHTIHANRVMQDGILKIDGLTADSGRSQRSKKELATDQNVYIGGFKGTHPYTAVTQTPFQGCIKDVTLGSTSRNLSENIEASDMRPGC